jgi:hypothetical protein
MVRQAAKAGSARELWIGQRNKHTVLERKI